MSDRAASAARLRLARGLAVDLLLLTAFWLFFFWQILVSRTHLIPYDLIDQHYMFQASVHRAMAAGESVWWTPDILSGYPIAADPLTAFFYPPNYLMHRLTPGEFLPYYRMEIQATLHFLLAAIGAYALARSLTGSRAGGLTAGLVYAFGAFFAWHLPHLSPVSTLSWLPWVFFAYHRAMAGRAMTWAAVSALAFGMAALAGHALGILQIGYAVAGVSLAVALGHRSRDRALAIRALGVGAATIVLGAGLAMVQLLPSLELSGETSRETLSYTDATGSSFDPRWTATALLPNFFSHDDVDRYWATGDIAETTMYAGLIPLFLAAFGVIASRGMARRLLLLILLGGIVALLLAFGSHTPIYRLMFEIAPGFDRVRRPVNFIVFTHLAVGLLAAFGVRAFMEGERMRLVRLLLGGIVAAILALALSGLARAGILVDAAPERVGVVVRGLLVAIVMLALAAGIVRIAGSRLSVGIAAVLLVAVVAVDLAAANGGEVYENHELRADSYIGPDWAGSPDNETVRFLRNVAGDVRIYPDRAGSIWENGPLVWGVRSIDGYSVLWPVYYEQLFNLAVGNPGSPVFDLMAVSHVVTSLPIEELYPGFDLSGFRLVYDGAWKVYENVDAMPRAWVARSWTVQPEDATIEWMTINSGSLRDTVVVQDEPVSVSMASGAEGEATIVHQENGRVVVRANLSQPGFVVLADTWYPGWTATIDGGETKIYRADQAFRAVWAPAGQHDIVFTFEPRSIRVGTVLSVGSLLLIGGLFVLGLRAPNLVERSFVTRRSTPPKPQ